MLYLAHHGDAVEPDVDPMRPLSERGRVEVEALARTAAERGARPDIVWHSGKLRARQTADAYRKHCNPLASFSAMRGLQPNDPVEWILDALSVEPGSILLTGHFPHLPRLFARLVGNAVGGNTFPLNGIVAVERADGKWIERWRLRPGGS